MTGRTHDLTAFTALHLTFLYTQFPQMDLATAAAGFGAVFIGGLTPDIDQPTADLWRRLPAGNIIGRIISPILGSHRMVSHSLIGIILTGYILSWILTAVSSIVLIQMTVVWWAFMIGFVSHVVIDLLNKEGVPLFFPIPWTVGIPPLRRLRIKTGGMAEKTLIYPGLMLLNAYLIYTHYTIYAEYIKNLL